MFRKWIVALMVTLAVVISLPTLVFAASSDELFLPAVQPPSFGSTGESETVLDDYVDIDAFRDYIFSNTYSCREEIDLSIFTLPATQEVTNAIYQFIWYQMPEAFNFRTAGFMYNTHTQKLTGMDQVMYYEFADTASEFETCWEAYRRAADKLLHGIEGNTQLTDVEKALLLHDRLAIWNEYDSANYEANTLPRESYSAYGALVKRTSVRQGYALAYDYLLERVGIRSDLCPSTALNHIWNIVYIDGLAYHVDVTWDDPTWDSTGRVKHTNFLRSTNGLRQTGHEVNGYIDYDSEPWSTKYDAYYWQNSEAEFRLLGDKLYYIDNNAHAIKYAQGAYSTTVLNIPGTWSSGASSYWIGSYSRLSSIGGELLYSMPNAIYAYNTATGEQRLIHSTSSSGYAHIYGFTYEDGILIVENTASPNYTQSTKPTSQMKYTYYGTYVTPSSVSITAAPKNTTYYIGDALSTDGMIISVTYSDGYTDIVFSNFTISGFDSAVVGKKAVTVSFGGANTAFNVTVKQPSISFKKDTLSFGCGVGSAPLNITTVPSGQTVTVKSTDRNVALPYSGSRIQIGESGTATITASFTYNGYVYRDTCVVTVDRSHTYKTTITRAAFKSNGKKVTACSGCGQIQSQSTIYALLSAKLSTTAYTYNGSVRKPNVIVTDIVGNTLKKDKDYTVTYPSGRKNAGTYQVKITFKGNYAGTKYLSFTINPIGISKCTVKLSTASYTYNGGVKTPSVTVKNANGTTLTKNTHYTVSYPSGRKNAGTYKVTVKMKGNYGGSKTLTFKINPISISRCTVKMTKTTFTYNGSVPSFPITVKNANGTKLTKGTHYTVKRVTGGINAGKHQILIKMKGNYSGSKTLTYTIKPTSISKCSVKLANTSLIYNGERQAVSAVVKNAKGTTLKKNTHYTVKWVTGGINVGEHKVLITMKGNYSGSKTLTYKIFPVTTTIKQLMLKGNSLTVTVAQRKAQVGGYQVQHSTSKSFTNAKTITVSGYQNTKLPVTVPTAKRKYYVRVRTYKVVGNTRYCSYWSTFSYERT